MSNLFSRFDARNRLFSLSWLAVLRLHLYWLSSFWLIKFPLRSIYKMTLNFLYFQFELNLGRNRNPGHSFWLCVCFIFICLNNFLGLLPYVFTASRHLVFSITFALIRWFTYYLLFLLKGLGIFLAHLVPLGTPYALIPLIVFIELIRGLIRPVTLGVRLVANMVAGHLLIILVRSPLRDIGRIIIGLGLVMLIILLFLESGVALIQGYVFSLLSSLYLAERNWRGLNYLDNLISDFLKKFEIKVVTFSIMEIQVFDL